jgi:hypothetical protein
MHMTSGRKWAPLHPGTATWAFAALVLVLGAFASRPAHGQIYECVGPNGGRVFSDEPCGPDAKIVRGITTKKRGAQKSQGARAPKRVARSATELDALLAQCDAGDLKACSEWTLGGGPGLLREREKKAEQDCEGGSLAACEERYCRDGVDADCRARVLRTAQLAGEDWYLREEVRGSPDGLVRYRIRCVPEEGGARDVTILCASQAGPDRCRVENASQRYSRLDRAAAAECVP